MRKLLSVIILCIASFLTYAQDKADVPSSLPVDAETHKVTFEEVVRVGESPKDDLFNLAHNWFAKDFPNTEWKIETDDKATGKIIARGIFHDSYKMFLKQVPFTLFFTMSVTVKDGRYRYEITDFVVADDVTEYNRTLTKIPLEDITSNPKFKNNKGEYKGYQKSYVEAASTEGIALSKSLKAALYQVPVKAKNKDDF